MFKIILFFLSSVALSISQLNVGPQTFPEQSSLSSRVPVKQFINNQGFKYIITPIQFNNAQNIRHENPQLGPQIIGKQVLPFINFSPIEEFQVQNREKEQVQPQILKPYEKPTYKYLQGLRLLKPYAEQKPRTQYQLVHIQLGKQLQKESSPITLNSNKDQLESELLEEIQQQLNRIINNNQVNLRVPSSVSEENKVEKVQIEQSRGPQSNNPDNEQGEAGLQKEVEDIVRDQSDFQLVKQNADEAELPNYQKSPFFVQRLVTKTQLHPVNIVKQVKIAVPTPVLVPVPEPYEVKVPRPYHVPVEVIRHIPVPLRSPH